MRRTRGVPGPPAERVLRVVQALASQIEHYVDGVARRLGSHRTDVAAIGLLVEARRAGEDVTPGDLGRRARLSAGAVTALLDRLERAGHVRRARHGSDQRRTLIELTDHARGVSRDMFAPLNRGMHAALEGYTPQELELVARVLDDLTRAAQDAVADTPLAPDRL